MMDMDVTDMKGVENIIDQVDTGNSILYERFLFNSRHQVEGETLASFVQNLRKMVRKCNFSGNSDDTILDRLICGVKDKRIQQFLLNQGNNKLQFFTLQKALEMAEEKELHFKTCNESFVVDQEFEASSAGDCSIGTLPLNIKSETPVINDIPSPSIGEVNSSTIQPSTPSQDFNTISDGISGIVDEKKLNGCLSVSKSEDLDEDDEMDDDEDFSDDEDGFQSTDIKNEKENAPPKITDLKFSARELFATKSASLRANRKEIECEACDYKCLTRHLLAAHAMAAHGMEAYCHKHVACSECLNVFLTPASLQAHSILAHGKRKVEKIYSSTVLTRKPQTFNCETCGYRANTMGGLKKHINLFHNDTKEELREAKLSKYRCEHCLFRALNADHLDQHIAMTHAEIKRTLTQCEFCDFATVSKGKFIKHMTKEHRGAKGFMCETCGKKFATDKSMEVHQKVVHENQKPYSCTMCDYKAGQKASLVGHMQGVHENRKPHVCEHCGYSTVSKSTLNNHLRMVHERRRPHVCSQCSRAFASRHGLHTHVQLIHEQQTPHCCEVCGRRFKRKPELINHVRCVHEGKYHVCQVCGHNFYSLRNLERHVMVVHEGQRPFACKDCGQRFARKERLKHHADRCHGTGDRNSTVRTSSGTENGVDSATVHDGAATANQVNQQLQQPPQQQQQQVHIQQPVQTQHMQTDQQREHRQQQTVQQHQLQQHQPLPQHQQIHEPPPQVTSPPVAEGLQSPSHEVQIQLPQHQHTNPFQVNHLLQMQQQAQQQQAVQAQAAAQQALTLQQQQQLQAQMQAQLHSQMQAQMQAVRQHHVPLFRP
jgi:hypothetical protein